MKAQHRHGPWRSFSVVLGAKASAGNDIGTQHREVLTRHELHGHRLGAARRLRSGHIHVVVAIERRKDPRERTRIAADPLEERVRNVLLFASSREQVERRQLAGILDWQHSQKDGIGKTEDGGVGANPERERGDRNRREPGRSAQHPKRVSQVAPRIVYPAERTRIAVVLFRLLYTAEGAAGGEACVLDRQATTLELVLQ